MFTLEQAPQALEQLSTLVEGAVPEEALSWTEDQAIEAFVNGEAIAPHRRAGPYGGDRLRPGGRGPGRGRLPQRAQRHRYSPAWSTPALGWRQPPRQAGNAVHFLTYLSNSDNNTHLAKACDTVPIHTTASDLEPSLEEGTLAVNMEMVRRANWYYYAQEPQMYQAQGGLAGPGQRRPGGVPFRGSSPSRSCWRSLTAIGPRHWRTKVPCGKQNRKNKRESPGYPPGLFFEII